MNEGRKSRYTNQSIKKAFEVLNLFGSESSKLSNTEIANKLDLRPGSIYPILYTLKEEGYLKKDGDKKYSLGIKFLEKSNVILENLDLRALAQPHLSSLASSLQGNSHLALLYETKVLYLEREEGSPSVTINEIVGHKVPAYCTALGKVLLTGLSENELNDYLESVELKKEGPNTITESEALLEELDKVERDGFSIDNEEFHNNLLAVAAPIKNYKNEIVAAISISFPKPRFPDLELEEPIRQVTEAAFKVSNKLGSSE